MQKFELFVESLQSAIVNSSESIRKRNESILEEYFYKEKHEVILENKAYNKELFALLDPIRSNDIFIAYARKENLNSISESDLKQMEGSSLGVSREDDLLARFLLETYSFVKKNNVTKIAEEKNSKELINSTLYTSSLFESIKKDNDSKEILSTELKGLIHLDKNLNLQKEKQAELANKKQAIISEWEDLKKQLMHLDSNTSEYKAIETRATSLPKVIDKLSREEVEINTEINKKKKELEKKQIKQLELKLEKKIKSIAAYEQLHQDYLDHLIEIILAGAHVVELIKDAKIDLASIVEWIKKSKRYRKKSIESLVPKTVRVNYPTTFDFATPNNDKVYQTINKPVEVPLLTLIPITNYNIEKATFHANFKFDVVEDEVMIDFSKDTKKEGEIAANFGKIEIILSPQQTPEGLKALIESYENFLKRQIT